MNYAKCRSCGAPIIWVRTERGAKMPLDATPTPAGAWAIDEAGVAHYVPPTATTTAALYRAHWATCPHAGQHRGQGSLPGVG